MEAAWMVGERRNKAAGGRGAKHLYGYTPDAQQESNTHAESAVSEALVAEVTGRRWLSTGDQRDPGGEDIEGGIGVRWSHHPNASLIIHPEDPDYLKMVLVTGNAPSQMIRGWHPVDESKQTQWWRTDVRYPAFFVPQAVLRPVIQLRLHPAQAPPPEVHPYCKPHASHFCPCCKPHLYDPYDPEDAKKIEGWKKIAPIVLIGGTP